MANPSKKRPNIKSGSQQPPAPLSPPPVPQPQNPQPPQQQLLPGIIQQAHWSGPYPPPDAVERYDAVVPGAFDRIIAMAEQLQAAQIDQSRRALDYSHYNGRRGHWLGFVAAILAMGGALFCAWIGSPWVD